MTRLLAEPSCYIFSADPTHEAGFEAACNDFLVTFKYFQDIVELNQVHVYLTKDLSDAVQGMFPYSSKAPGMSRMYEATGVVLRFLDKHAALPLWDYQLRDTTIDHQSLSRASALYQHEDVWLAWVDLLAQVLGVKVTAGEESADVMASQLETSCFLQNVTPLILDAASIDVRACRADKKVWPRKYLDPDVLERMRKRRRGTGIAAAWEDSGHQPSIAIKRALVRSAAAVNEFVARVGSTYYNPKLAETCKLSLSSDFGDIEFRISDGQSTLKGCFTTIARDAEEQRVALRLLSREFRDQCNSAGFSYANDEQ
ncbi:MAG: hypothetical protein Q8S73_15830 [Deltaproteobacteria bacterium]|nr:hypothetical protein [Myxococcales bacterium]MDP3215577.1 hypothetical protein [Deltaproteobacteria bacterium]